MTAKNVKESPTGGARHRETQNSKEDFYALLFKVYHQEQGWQFEGTRSNIHVSNGQLRDDFCDSAIHKALVIDGKLVFGFRIVPDAEELRRYPNTVPQHILDDCIEGNRIVVQEGFRGLQMSQLVGKYCFEHCRKNGVRYTVFGSSEKNMVKRFARFQA